MDKARAVKVYKFVLSVILGCIMLCLLSSGTNAAVIPIDPDAENSPYLEFRIVSVEAPAEGEDKLVTAQLWAYNMEFKAIELKLAFDNTKVKPYDIDKKEDIDENNATDENMFLMADEIKEGLLDEWFMGYMPGTPEWLKYAFSVLYEETVIPPFENRLDSEGEDYTVIVADGDGVYLGKFVYRLFDGKIDKTTFGLKSTKNEETGEIEDTGIKVIINEELDQYIDPKIFRVTYVAESDNADLADIKIDDESIENFHKDTLEYTVEILEEKEKVILEPVVDDENASLEVKKKTPDPENEGQYIYEVIEVDTGQDTYEMLLEGLRRGHRDFNNSDCRRRTS